MLACIAFQWGMPINLSHSGALRRTVTSFPTPEGTTTGPGPPVALGLRPPVPELPDYLLTGTGSGTEYLRTTVSDKHLEITVFLALFFVFFFLVSQIKKRIGGNTRASVQVVPVMVEP